MQLRHSLAGLHDASKAVENWVSSNWIESKERMQNNFPWLFPFFSYWKCLSRKGNAYLYALQSGVLRGNYCLELRLCNRLKRILNICCDFIDRLYNWWK